MQKQKRTISNDVSGPLAGAVRHVGKVPAKNASKGEFDSVRQNRDAIERHQEEPTETAYEQQMRLMREIGKRDKTILAVLAK